MSAQATGPVPADSSLDSTLDWLRLAARDRAHSSAEFEQDVSDLRSRLDTELARVSNARNSALSLQARLPDELWCLAWQDLPLVDRLALLRVCRTWRTLALRSPSIWSTLDVNLDLHHPDCHCEPCRDDRQDFRKRYLAMDAIAIRSTKTNLHLIPRALFLGQNVPLTIHISDIASESNDDSYEYLGQHLLLFTHRLRALHLDLQDSRVVHQLLEAVGDLNALQTFSVTCSGEPCIVHEPHQIATRATAWSALQSLRLPKCLIWRFEDSMTALRDLWCGVQSVSEIAFILEACVNLSYLTLDLHDELDHLDELAPIPASLRLLVHERARTLKDIAFRGVTSRNESDIIGIFAIAEIETLSFIYDLHHAPTSQAVEQITGPFQSPIVLSCTASSKGPYHRVSLLARTTGPTRAISQKSDPLLLRQTWGYFSKCLPQGVVVAGSCWRTLHADGWQGDLMPNTFMFSMLVSVVEELAHLPLVHHHFPQLKLVCIRGSAASEAIIPVESIIAVVDSLVAPGSFLDSLLVQQIRIEGDDTALRRKAGTVTLPTSLTT